MYSLLILGKAQIAGSCYGGEEVRKIREREREKGEEEGKRKRDRSVGGRREYFAVGHVVPGVYINELMWFINSVCCFSS